MHEITFKVEILSLIIEERKKLEGVIQKLSHEQLIQPGVHGAWSIKDIIVHIAVWEERGTEWIKSFAKGIKPHIPLEGYTWKDYRKLNQQTYEENRNRPWEEVLAYSQETYRKLINTIEEFPETNLDLSFSFESFRLKTVSGRDVIHFRYLHYQSHLEKISLWMKSQQQ
ncbi:MAG: DinB family protein [Promethearchaeota archaeon]